MVKAQRKTSHCLRRQSASKMEVEMTTAQPEDQAQGETEAPQEVAEPHSEELPPKEPEVQPQGQETTTVDQSCQTEEMQQSNPEPNHCQSSGCSIEPGDPPLLQQPLQTSKSGIQQIIECFRSGTGQLKHMLLREVDTIFECKLCRSLFRGLPNLITHKEYYCLTRISEPDGPSSDDKQSVAIRDLLEAIYPKKDGPDYVVRLEPIQASNKAVFQYLSSEDELARYPPQTPRSSHNHSPEPWDEEEDEEELEDLDEDEDDEDEEEGEEEEEENEQGNQEPGAEDQSNRMSEPEEGDEEVEEENAQPEEEGSSSGVEDVIISCCLCGKDFNSRRSVRRHCRKMHKTKLEELRKFTETRTVPISLLSMVKGRPRNPSTPTGKSCPVCSKSFATKANVRRHFDEVHRGLRRDAITPDIATRPGQPLSLESTPPRKRAASSPMRVSTPKRTPSTPKVQTTSQSRRREAAMYNLEACRCLVCKRKYSSQLMLRRHMRIVHKITKLKSSGTISTATAASAEGGANALRNNSSALSNNVRVKQEVVEPLLDEADSSPASSPGDSNLVGIRTVAVGTKRQKVKEEERPASPKSSSSSSASGQASGRHPTLSVGFDFKQLFCKLCKRQFSSRQNLTKHIELHTDGTDIFIKFYRCPLCRYESRRKRDVLRHITVVHKKSTVYLAKIMPKLENRAIKRPAEVVLNNYSKRNKEDINGQNIPPQPPSPPLTRKQDLISSSGPSSSSSTPAARKQQEASGSAPLTPSTSVTRKQDRRPTSPPLTRRSDKLQQDSQAAHNTRRGHDAQQESGSSSTEVRVTKNFSLHACDVCGRAFAKKIYLESHKRSHRNAMAAASSTCPDSLRKGVSTRSKALLW